MSATNCRLCGHDQRGEVIDLGSIPLVNNLLRFPDEAAPRYPLHVVFCRACGLAQLTENAPPEAMFEDYLYFSSQSQTMVEHARALVERYVQPKDQVLEIASNDGYLLRPAQERGATVLGVDPARNVAAYANERGIPTRCDYFNAETAQDIAETWGQADLIFANNVLAHVPDPNQIFAGIARVLAPAGRAHVEVPYLRSLLDRCAFDTIYHEHFSYFSITPLLTLAHRHGLHIIEVEEIAIHGGSLHIQLAHEGDETAAQQYTRREREAGLLDDATYATFAQRLAQIRTELLATIDRYDTVAGYGAAAKAVVLLNVFGLGTDRLPWVADVSPHKQGRFAPGTRQAIVPPQRLLDEQPDACILFPWNLEPEIIRRNHEYLERGGRFIIPIPLVREVSLSRGIERINPSAS